MSDTTKLSLEFPKSFVEGLGTDEAQAAEAIKQSAVMDLFRQRKISHRKGAELLGLSYRDFQELASQHQVSLFEYEDGWADRELSGLESRRTKSL